MAEERSYGLLRTRLAARLHAGSRTCTFIVQPHQHELWSTLTLQKLSSMSAPERQPRVRDKLKPSQLFSIPHRSRSRASSPKVLEPKSDTSKSIEAGSTVQVNGTLSSKTANLSIYQQAFQGLSKEDQETIGHQTTTNGDDLQASINAAEILRSTCYRARFTWQFRGKDICLRDQADNVFKLLKQLVPVGDAVAGLDPVHIGLPWAGIKTILELALASSKQRELLLEGIELSLYNSRRLSVYSKFLTAVQPSPAASNMQESLVEMYKCILQFIALAIRVFKRNPAVRLIAPLWTLSEIEDFDKSSHKWMENVSKDAQNCDREVWQTTVRSLDNALRDFNLQIENVSSKLDLSSLDAKVAASALYDSSVEASQPRCLLGTRTQLLERVKQWTESEHRIYWLVGQAGSGKSTISRTLAEHLQSTGCIVATFFFKRTEARRRDASFLFPTIVKQLIDQVEPLRGSVAKALKNDSLLCEKGLYQQYSELLENPLKECTSLPLKIFLVVDALDECESADAVRGIIKVLLGVEIRLRVFITSRPEHPIVEEFARGKTHEKFNLEEIEATVVEHDIQLFIQDRLQSYIPSTDPAIGVFTKMATPLFIAASTLCSYITESSLDPEGTIDELVRKEQTLSTNMIDFYFGILDDMTRHFSKQIRKQFTAAFHEIIAPVTVLADPLAATSLSPLLDIPVRKIERTLEKLQSVLSINGPIRPLHLSFYECIAQPGSEFSIDKPGAHATLFRSCIQLLSSSLKQDLLDVKMPGTLRKEVYPHVLNDLSAEFWYACQYWPFHFEESKVFDADVLYSFLKIHLLHWFEAMSWLQKLTEVLSSLAYLSERSRSLVITSAASSSLQELLRDAQKFLQQNLYIIDTAPLQIYLSALVRSPQDSAIIRHFGPVLDSNEWFEKLPRSSRNWDVSSWTVPVRATAIAISHNRQRIAICATDASVRLVSTLTGAWCSELPNPFHVRYSHLGFSPDDKTLAAIERDRKGAEVGNKFVSWDLDTGTPQAREYPYESELIPLVSSDMQLAVTETRDVSRGDVCTIFVDRFNPLQRTILVEKCGIPGTRVLSKPSGNHLAIALGFHQVDMFDTKTAKCVYRARYENDTGVIRLAISSDHGERLAVLLKKWEGNASVWINVIDITTRTIIQRIGPYSDIGSLAFFQVGTDLKLGYTSNSARVMEQWVISESPQQAPGLHHLDHVHNTYKDIVHLDDCQLIIDHGAFVKSYKADNIPDNSRFQVRNGDLTDIVRAAATSPSARCMASATESRCLELWDIKGRLIRSWEHTLGGGTDREPRVGLTFSPDGTLLAGYLNRPGRIKIWSLATASFVQEMSIRHDHSLGASFSIDQITISSNNRYLACKYSTTRSNTVRIYDMATGTCMHEWPFSTEDLSPRDLFISSKDGMVSLTEDGQTGGVQLELRDLATGHVVVRAATEVPKPYLMHHSNTCTRAYLSRFRDVIGVVPTREIHTLGECSVRVGSLEDIVLAPRIDAEWITYPSYHRLFWLSPAQRNHGVSQVLGRTMLLAPSDAEAELFVIREGLDSLISDYTESRRSKIDPHYENFSDNDDSDDESSEKERTDETSD